ncbi:MAG: hypothetical protein ACK46A_11750, partial [Akkermansiaceae bacterium]
SGDAGFELGSEMSSLSFHMSDFGVICPSQTSQSFNKTLAPFCGTTSDDHGSNDESCAFLRFKPLRRMIPWFKFLKTHLG